MVFFSWATAAWAVVATIMIFWMLHKSFQIQYVQTTPSAINDDESAVRSFLCMLNEAQGSLIIFDDGDDIDGSLYNDRRVINAVQDKLRDNPEFELRCLFNCDEDLLFRKELESERHVSIRIRSSSVPTDGIHYKIIDGGAKAYLSRHTLGSREQRFRIVDCSRVPRRHRGRVADIVLGRYKEDFEHAFEASAPAI